MRILGVDPGISGALFLWAPDQCLVLDMPVVQVRDLKRRVSGALLRDWLLNEAKPDHAFIEQVNAMPSIPDPKTGERRGMGSSTSFQFGRAVGAIEAAIEVCGVPWEHVPSPRWKKHHGLRGSDKEASRRMAIQLLPTCAGMFARKLDQGRAEAALLALYGCAQRRTDDDILAVLARNESLSERVP